MRLGSDPLELIQPWNKHYGFRPPWIGVEYGNTGCGGRDTKLESFLIKINYSQMKSLNWCNGAVSKSAKI